MKRPTRWIVLHTVICSVVVVNTSMSAQSFVSFAAGDALERTSSTAAREYVPDELVSGSVSPPSNIVVPDVYRNLVDVMLRRSATFRRQCLRISAEPRVLVSVDVSPRSFGAGIRAMTQFRRSLDGRLTADVHLSTADDEVELLSHELEHVIEQLDQIDLSSKAAQSDSGVRRTVLDTALFETKRATRTGLKVAQEMRGSARKAD
jgi:hypothetical protein